MEKPRTSPVLIQWRKNEITVEHRETGELLAHCFIGDDSMVEAIADTLSAKRLGREAEQLRQMVSQARWLASRQKQRFPLAHPFLSAGVTMAIAFSVPFAQLVASFVAFPTYKVGHTQYTRSTAAQWCRFERRDRQPEHRLEKKPYATDPHSSLKPKWVVGTLG